MEYPFQNIYVPRGYERHPEAGVGEIWITNASVADFMELSYQSKRIGKQAYTNRGTPTNDPNLRPVFVQLAEYNQAQKIFRAWEIDRAEKRWESEKQAENRSSSRWMALEI